MVVTAAYTPARTAHVFFAALLGMIVKIAMHLSVSIPVILSEEGEATTNMLVEGICYVMALNVGFAVKVAHVDPHVRDGIITGGPYASRHIRVRATLCPVHCGYGITPSQNPQHHSLHVILRHVGVPSAVAASLFVCMSVSIVFSLPSASDIGILKRRIG